MMHAFIGGAGGELKGREVLVIGCGVIGLTSALSLQKLGARVTIWAKDIPPNTTSNIAAAFWYPFLSAPVAKVSAWSNFTINYYRNNLIDEKAGIMTTTVREVFETPIETVPEWTRTIVSFKRLKGPELQKGYVDGWIFDTVVINSDICLAYLLSSFLAAGGVLEQRHLQTLDEGFPFFNVIVNCSGLGARELCPDPLVYPIRGQVLRLRQSGARATPGIFFTEPSSRDLIYIVPRQNDIIVGGTAQDHDFNLNVNPQDSKDIFKRCRECLDPSNFPMLSAEEEAGVLETRVGLRPARKEIRLEVEEMAFGQKFVVHNYGHGGSGWTVCWGCAEEVTQHVKDIFGKLGDTSAKL